MVFNWVVIGFCLLAIAVGGTGVFLRKRRRSLHLRKLREAERVYAWINSDKDAPSEAYVISYLRKIDPYCFEELVLLAFRNKGYRTVRNRRYSGDGGKDGVVEKNGMTYFVQSKRYAKHIHFSHVEDFEELCLRNFVQGYFVHTGRTGRQSRRKAHTGGVVSIVSGSRLVNLLRSDKTEF